MRRVLIIAALSALVLAPTPVGAAEQVDCKGVLKDIVVSPGLSTEPNSGVYHSSQKTGTLECGDLKGTFGIDGRYGTEDPDSCQSGGEGWGVFVYTFEGEDEVRDTFTVKFGPNTEGTDAGHLEGEYLAGKYTFTGTEGNCVTSPITKGDLSFFGTLTR